MSKPHPEEMVVDQGAALARASFELSFESPKPLGPARAALLQIHWVAADPANSRTMLIGADLSGLIGGRGDAGALASAMAFKARSGLLARGAGRPPGYADDFPSAPIMASADVASCSCAVAWPASMGLAAMVQASLDSLAGMFEAWALRSRHIKASRRAHGDLERAANQIIAELRGAKPALGGAHRTHKEPTP